MNAYTIDLTKIHIHKSWYRTPVWRNLPKLIHTCTCDTCMTSLTKIVVHTCTCKTCMTSLTWTGSCRRSPRSPHNTDTRSPRYTGTPPSLGLHHSHEAAKRTHIFTPRENPSSINAPKKKYGEPVLCSFLSMEKGILVCSIFGIFLMRNYKVVPLFIVILSTFVVA